MPFLKNREMFYYYPVNQYVAICAVFGFGVGSTPLSYLKIGEWKRCSRFVCPYSGQWYRWRGWDGGNFENLAYSREREGAGRRITAQCRPIPMDCTETGRTAVHCVHLLSDSWTVDESFLSDFEILPLVIIWNNVVLTGVSAFVLSRHDICLVRGKE